MTSIANLPDGYRHVALGEIASTNATALEFAKDGDPGKLWVTAASQSRGRGSRGREWRSEPGNLYASLLLYLTLEPQKLANLTFVASLALHDSLTQRLGVKNVSLKWPNDVLVEGSKVSGILLESHHTKPNSNDRLSTVIIGMGVNCLTHPQTANYQATNLAVHGMEIAPLDLFSIVADRFAHYFSIWDQGQNFTEIRRLWIEKAAGLGEQIIVKMPREELRGIFVDIDNHGCLQLKTADGKIHLISTADIFFSNLDKKGA